MEERNFLKWSWMADWCKNNKITPYNPVNWRNAEKAYEDKFNTKSEFDLLKKKYDSGDYICIKKHGAKWKHLPDPEWYASISIDYYKLIHKKHKEVLDAYLADNSVEIKAFYLDWFYEKDFIKNYNENTQYYLIQQYPIFKRNEDGCVINVSQNVWMLNEDITRIGDTTACFETTINNMETIPYDKERGLYHLQPVFMWDDWSKTREINFFKIGKEYTVSNIEPITPEQLKTIPFIWDMYQKILKDTK